jgi:hypothetical protein
MLTHHPSFKCTALASRRTTSHQSARYAGWVQCSKKNREGSITTLPKVPRRVSAKAAAFSQFGMITFAWHPNVVLALVAEVTAFSFVPFQESQPSGYRRGQIEGSLRTDDAAQGLKYASTFRGQGIWRSRAVCQRVSAYALHLVSAL